MVGYGCNGHNQHLYLIGYLMHKIMVLVTIYWVVIGVFHHHTLHRETLVRNVVLSFSIKLSSLLLVFFYFLYLLITMMSEYSPCLGIVESSSMLKFPQFQFFLFVVEF